MPACSRTRERAPSAATSSAADTSPSPSDTAMRLPSCAKLVTAVARSSIPCARALAASAALSGAFSIMWANGSPGFDFAREGEEHRPHRVLQLGVGHHHVENRLRVRRRPRPTRRASRTCAAPRPRSRRRACPACASAAKAGSATTTLNDVAKPLAQRERKREAGEPAAGDHHIGACDFWLVGIILAAQETSCSLQ